MLDFSDLTEKLESNAQILNQTLRQISALENALMFHGAVRNKGNDKIYLKTFINKIQIWPIVFGLLDRVCDLWCFFLFDQPCQMIPIS